MAIGKKKAEDARRRILRSAEELTTQRSADRAVEEMTQLGIVWCGILNLDTAIPPSDVAAMLAAHDLVRATRYVDSEEYWTSAAAYSALGAFAEGGVDDEIDPLLRKDLEEDCGSRNPIGFVARGE